MQFERSKLWLKVLLLALPVALQSLPCWLMAGGLAAKLHFLLLVLMFGVVSVSGIISPIQRRE